ncbi:RagB/SusD family nutrient uptake outer membrane protein [Pedobacter frigoris]|uniref:RagB/SusD family nutrient uptake outer membrane protein n=1 Tax=Pedobacter frigoris TaxID=2571272 RepID=A0A4U1CG74_9SPHI|nr:RagB/SusD family nutrient uptake outer membrane protein [Pedobacter frigoris]TKC06202.1 RagB/SusD family nutrient uptake outer membrane protein [Pedobacter frigoris]
MQIGLNRILGSLLLLLILQSCGKEWLEAKPDKSLVVPETIKDYQSLLDNAGLFNAVQACGLGEMGAGDFYVTDANWQNVSTAQERSAYTWAPTSGFYGDDISLDWGNAYKRVLNANVVLTGIEKIKILEYEQQDWNNVKGSALFFRAFDFFNLAQEYCVAYNSTSANVDLGLPLRLDYDVNIKLKRSSLQQTYDRIVADLEAAAGLLGTKPLFKTRPSKEAAYALLARTYLSMENYERAGHYANLALQIQAELVDYSKLNANASFPIARFNAEVIFHSTFYYGIFNPSRMNVVPELFNEYVAADCRKTVFFGPTGLNFKGSYNGDRSLFGGLATNEMYLIRAEANARANILTAALTDLNTLRRNRWKGIYTDLNSTDQSVVLDYVVKERRRELLFRGVRWSDLRRLNKYSKFAVTLSRTINGTTYTLQPNDKRYVFPIDEEEIHLSGSEQNER